jgi:hypothetical protein
MVDPVPPPRITRSLSQAMRRFGSNVSVIDRNDRLLHREDVPLRYHPAFALANSAHINGEVSVENAKLLASAKVRGNLRAMNNVLAGQTGDIRARSSNVFAFNNRDPLSLCSKRPRSNGRSRAAAKDHQIVIFRRFSSV